MLPYYNGKYIGDSGKHPDKKNEAERFPESKFPGVYRPADFISFQSKDKEKIKKISEKLVSDIQDLKSCFQFIYYGIKAIERGDNTGMYVNF